MKKLTKKILSLMLAVIMAMPVVLAMPSQASAEISGLDAHLRAHYFIDNHFARDNWGGYNLEQVNGGTYYWSNGGVAFPGSNKSYFRVRLNDMLSTVNFNDGFTLVFTARRNSNGWHRYLELTNNGGYGNGETAESFFFSTNGNAKVNHPGGNNNKKNETGSPDVGEDGGWHTWTVIFKNGSFQVFRDGASRGTQSDSGRINFDWFNAIKNDGYLALGASSYSGDPNFNGWLKNVRVYDCPLTSSQISSINDNELFQWTFDSTLDERFTGSSNAASVMQSWNGNYSNEGDHIYCKDSWMMASVPSRMRSDKYKKNWRMDFDINPTQDFGANRLELMPGITDQTGLDSGYNGGQSFGMSTNGKIYFRTTDFNNGAIGDVGLNLKNWYNNNGKTRVTVSYAYHDGVISVLVDFNLKFSYDVSNYKSFFENINTVTFPGLHDCGVYMDLWDFSCIGFADVGNVNDHLKGRYFLGDVTKNTVEDKYHLTSSGTGATWMENDGIEGARFNGKNKGKSPNYLYMPKNTTKDMLKRANETTGLTFSLMSKSIRNNSWQRLFELTNVGSAYGGGDANTFLMFTSQYNGSVHLRYNGGSSTHEELKNIDSWHVWTVTVQEGLLRIYRDGVAIRTDYSSRYDGHWFNEVITNGQLLLGASTYSDPGYDGYIRDFRVYDIALTSSQVSDVYNDTYNNRTYYDSDGINSSNIGTYRDAIQSAVTAYENKMKGISSDFLTKTKPAYEAYVIANRYLYAIDCGQSTHFNKKELQKVASDLTNATNAMNNWSYKTGTARGRFGSDANRVSDSDYAAVYKNLVYCSECTDSGDGGASAWVAEFAIYSNSEKVNPRVFHPIAVMLYDGVTEPQVPVLAHPYHWTTNNHTYNVYWYAAYLQSDKDNLYLPGKWHGPDKNGDFNFQGNWLNNGELSIDYTDTTSMWTHWSQKSGLTSSGKYYWSFSNLIKYKTDFGSNSYSKKIQPKWGFNVSNHDDPNNDMHKVTSDNDRHPIYVLNYKPIRTKLGEAKSNYAKNVADYKEGGLETYFQGCDEATAIDPQNNYNWSNVEDCVNDCAGKIKTAVDHMNESKIADSLYPSLKAELRTAHNNHPTGNSAYTDFENYWGIYDVYTKSTCEAFYSAYWNARWHMGSLATHDFYFESTADNNKRLNDLVSTHAGLVRKASFTALDSAYTSAKSAQDVLDSDLYTTSSVSTYNTFLNTAGNFPYHSKDTNARDDTPITEQSSIDDEASSLSTAQSRLLVNRASFTALDSAYSAKASEFAALTASDYTTSTYNAANTFLSTNGNFPYHFKTAEQKADTAASFQGAIDTEKANIENALNNLELRADFSALDAAKKVWTDYLTNHSAEYTTSSKTALSNYINSTSEFVLENTADRADTGVSQNSAIAAEVTKYGNIDANDYLDPVANLSKLQSAYDKGDALLESLVGKTAQYDGDSVQALINAVSSSAVSAYLDAEPAEKANFGTKGDISTSDQLKANKLADNIDEAIAGLKISEIIDEDTGETVDTSVFDSLVNTINNLDPDAYEENAGGSLAAAQRFVNENYGTAVKVYDGQNINVVNGITTQEEADLMASKIQDALTVCIKKYVIIKNAGVSDVAVNNGKEEGGMVNYGATLTCKSKKANGSLDSDTAWFLEIQTGSMHKKLAFQSYGATLKTKVLGITTVNAIKRDETNNCRVMITRSYGADDDREPVQYVNFVPSGTEFTLPASPAIAYSSFNGYSYKDGDAIAVNGDGDYVITVNGDVEIVANYTESAAACAINATDIAEVEHNSTVKYNEKVELDGGEGTYGWIEEIGDTYRPFYKGQNVSFLATESTTLIAVNETNFRKYGATPCVNLRKSGVEVTDTETGKKYTFNAQLVPGTADVREYGILVAAPSSKNGYTPITPADTQIIIENSGQQAGYAILRAKSTKLVGANQFTIAINNLPAGYKYRGYVIYSDGTSLQTAYSDVM